ncbi:MAG: dTDP-4-dehydrorhamnose reductase [Omnitrophica bacterium]|nr:dTDP-4-dehydrorhamnose reductase [Candidatus Omnitrophota bacterium]
MKVAVIGANGQLGTDICQVFRENNHTVVELNHDRLEVKDIDQVSTLLKDIKPEVVINTAAAHHLEKCELNPEQAFLINSIGARNVALVAKEVNSTLIWISTDYVFNGKKRSPYIEKTPVSPLNTYGISKVAGEFCIKESCRKYFIVRTSGLYGLAPCRAKGENFVVKMLRLAKEKKEISIVNNEILTPTWTYSLAKQILHFCKCSSIPYGIVHSTDEGECSWFEFAKEIFRNASIKIKLIPVKTTSFSSAVHRPNYSVLENKILKKHKKNIMQHWKKSIANYLKLYLGR